MKYVLTSAVAMVQLGGCGYMGYDAYQYNSAQARERESVKNLLQIEKPVSIEDFGRRFDTNGDGLVDRTEAKKIERWMK